jgi:selenocysteine lyase/cysteine desulfurase
MKFHANTVSKVIESTDKRSSRNCNSKRSNSTNKTNKSSTAAKKKVASKINVPESKTLSSAEIKAKATSSSDQNMEVNHVTTSKHKITGLETVNEGYDEILTSTFNHPSTVTPDSNLKSKSVTSDSDCSSGMFIQFCEIVSMILNISIKFDHNSYSYADTNKGTMLQK